MRGRGGGIGLAGSMTPCPGNPIHPSTTVSETPPRRAKTCEYTKMWLSPSAIFYTFSKTPSIATHPSITNLASTGNFSRPSFMATATSDIWGPWTISRHRPILRPHSIIMRCLYNGFFLRCRWVLKAYNGDFDFYHWVGRLRYFRHRVA